MDKRTHIILTALSLFYQKGIHSVGINEIISVAGVAKKTMYHHFTSKDELLLACLSERHTRFLNWLTHATSKLTTIEEFKVALISCHEAWFNSEVTELGDFNGCLFINTAAEFADPASPINQACKEHKMAVQQLIKQRLSACENMESSQLDSHSYYLMTLVEGMICQAKLVGIKQFPYLKQ
ncbi:MULTISPECIES: TetR/AcrR family transcriptional regulator [unclassified Pseudoalteromonas]|uniref:TetR/AcrR family transcriptional regulator n=1 Tax=unclassified Pseudoalteromonas TaxID=194690 RepID=UPI00110BF29A|nr:MULTISPECIES: TetR/AcrR family transcriptional regulator [unclassified Pseudoalteromonas]TMP41498.1 TetR/AcrR family transcriptional regulator [Pseudoalteromonas sp. S1650]TMP64398.1 TetR/AcrR family transcriptional regulator [Pseudoalteromonas sp. S1649]